MTTLSFAPITRPAERPVRQRLYLVFSRLTDNLVPLYSIEKLECFIYVIAQEA